MFVFSLFGKGVTVSRRDGSMFVQRSYKAPAQPSAPGALGWAPARVLFAPGCSIMPGLGVPARWHQEGAVCPPVATPFYHVQSDPAQWKVELTVSVLFGGRGTLSALQVEGKTGLRPEHFLGSRQSSSTGCAEVPSPAPVLILQQPRRCSWKGLGRKPGQPK